MNEILLVNKDDIVAIADATREKAGISNKLTLSDIANSISSISGGDSGDGGIDFFEANKHINIEWNLLVSGDTFLSLDDFYLEWCDIDSENGYIQKQYLSLSSPITQVNGVVYCLPLYLWIMVSSNYALGQAWIDQIEIIDANTGNEIYDEICEYNVYDSGNSNILMLKPYNENYSDIVINIYYSIG